MKLAILFSLICFQAFGHGKGKHAETLLKEEVVTKDSFKAVYESISNSYKKNVEPIFKAKCFDCHSAQTKYPWYYQIPGVNLLMNYHIKESRSHLDMQFGFPFKGHGTPKGDLDAIEKTVNEGAMPPMYYKVFHDKSSLNKKESKTILEWLKKSKEQLKEVK